MDSAEASQLTDMLHVQNTRISRQKEFEDAMSLQVEQLSCHAQELFNLLKQTMKPTVTPAPRPQQHRALTDSLTDENMINWGLAVELGFRADNPYWYKDVLIPFDKIWSAPVLNCRLVHGVLCLCPLTIGIGSSRLSNPEFIKKSVLRIDWWMGIWGLQAIENFNSRENSHRC